MLSEKAANGGGEGGLEGAIPLKLPLAQFLASLKLTLLKHARADRGYRSIDTGGDTK